MAGDHRRVLFLAAKTAARFGLDDAHAIAGQAEQHGQRTMHVVRALHRSVHRDAAAIFGGHGDHTVRLDVELLLRPDAVLAFDDRVGFGESGVEIALVDRDRLERQLGRCGIVVRRARFVIETDGGRK